MELQEIYKAIEAGACYIEAQIGSDKQRLKVTSYDDNSGWVVTNNKGTWIDEKRFMVTRHELKVDEFVLQCYLEEVGCSGACPACNADNDKEIEVGVYECQTCGCLHGQMYLGESYNFVLPYFADEHDNQAQERAKPFDLTCLGSEGITRRHGWYDPQTKRIIQVG